MKFSGSNQIDLCIWISLLSTSECESGVCVSSEPFKTLICMHLHSAYPSSSPANCDACPVLDLKRSTWKEHLHLTRLLIEESHQCQHPCRPGYATHRFTRQAGCMTAILRQRDSESISQNCGSNLNQSQFAEHIIFHPKWGTWRAKPSPAAAAWEMKWGSH